MVLDGHLLIVTKKATISLAPASRTGYEEMASLRVFDDLVWTPASYADGSLFREREVELVVHLPHGYCRDRRYPVAYVLDGDASVESAHMDITLDNLAGKTVEPLIAVFIPYLGQWWPYKEYVGEKLDELVRVLLEEIVPRVDGEYATIPRPEGRALIGRYNTTYASVYAAFRFPGQFAKLGLQTMRWEPGYRPHNRQMLEDAPRQQLTVYLDWSTYDAKSEMEGNDFRAFSIAFAEDLRAAGYDFVGGEAHDGSGWTSWRNRTDKLLEALFPLALGEEIRQDADLPPRQ
jgi:enterochelin esterase-like enzyme